MHPVIEKIIEDFKLNPIRIHALAALPPNKKTINSSTQTTAPNILLKKAKDASKQTIIIPPSAEEEEEKKQQKQSLSKALKLCKDISKSLEEKCAEINERRSNREKPTFKNIKQIISFMEKENITNINQLIENLKTLHKKKIIEQNKTQQNHEKEKKVSFNDNNNKLIFYTDHNWQDPLTTRRASRTIHGNTNEILPSFLLRHKTRNRSNTHNDIDENKKQQIQLWSNIIEKLYEVRNLQLILPHLNSEYIKTKNFLKSKTKNGDNILYLIVKYLDREHFKKYNQEICKLIPFKNNEEITELVKPIKEKILNDPTDRKSFLKSCRLDNFIQRAKLHCLQNNNKEKNIEK